MSYEIHVNDISYIDFHSKVKVSVSIRDGNATNFGPHSHSDSLSKSVEKIGLIHGFAFLDFLRIPHFRNRISDSSNIFKGFYK